MKFAILGDTHWGARKDSPVFYKHFEAFYDQFFAHLDKEGIKTVIQCGDTFEARQRTNTLSLSEACRIYFDRAEAKGIYTYITVGNHDIYHLHAFVVRKQKAWGVDYYRFPVIDVVVPYGNVGVNSLGLRTVEVDAASLAQR